MFTLVTDKSKYFKVKRGQRAGEIEKVLNTPVHGSAFAGMIIRVEERALIRYTAKVGDNYRTIAVKFRADEEEVKRLNANKPVYPTCKLFVPSPPPRGI